MIEAVTEEPLADSGPEYECVQPVLKLENLDMNRLLEQTIVTVIATIAVIAALLVIFLMFLKYILPLCRQCQNYPVPKEMMELV